MSTKVCFHVRFFKKGWARRNKPNAPRAEVPVSLKSGAQIKNAPARTCEKPSAVKLIKDKTAYTDDHAGNHVLLFDIAEFSDIWEREIG